jgi:tRNA(adenine34) deaminase
MTTEQDYSFMRLALEEANAARVRNEVPIGAVIVDSQTGEILARQGNRTLEMRDPSAHAEMLTIREACAKKGAQRIPECDLYVTLEPCAMCAAAISFARIRRLIIGALDEKGGGVFHGPRFYEQPTCHHRPLIESGPLAAEAGALLKNFFSEKRKKN